MKFIYAPFTFAFLLFIGCGTNSDSNSIAVENTTLIKSKNTFTTDADMQSYFKDEVHGVQVLVEAKILKELSDDNDGSRHQRFIVELNSGQSLLVAHNIDLAPRVNNLSTGESIIIYGQYEWNSSGGVIHWTHYDPKGFHENGWIEYQGETFR
ncbi:DUF3465 domain-containing protein [Crocinitomix sp.]|nr:DUF3465 domain-containing protein [Crocinitomix sp.]